MLQGPDLLLSPSPEGERPDLPSLPEAFATPAPSPPGETAQAPPPCAPIEEEMVPDARAALTPAQMVERKVVALLKGGALPLRYAVTGPPSDAARRRRPRSSTG